jgi:hypothetical protein
MDDLASRQPEDVGFRAWAGVVAMIFAMYAYIYTCFLCWLWTRFWHVPEV